MGTSSPLAKVGALSLLSLLGMLLRYDAGRPLPPSQALALVPVALASSAVLLFGVRPAMAGMAPPPHPSFSYDVGSSQTTTTAAPKGLKGSGLKKGREVGSA